MSVIVASNSIWDGGCAMAFDSAIAGTEMILETKTPKAIKHAGNGLIGAAGSWRVINVISLLQDQECTPETVVEFLEPYKGEDFMSDMEILCAWPNKPLVIIQSDLSVIEVASHFMAVGSGAPYALGYLEGVPEYSIDYLINAVKVSSKYSPGVSGPVKSLYCSPVERLR